MEAQFVYTFQNNYQLDATAAANIAAINLVPCTEERADDLSVCSDQTVIAAVGVITRTISVLLTASFLSKFPAAADRIAALTGLYKQRLQQMYPGECTEVLTVGGAFCP